MYSDIEVVGLFENAQSAANDVRRTRPDVVLMDIEMPGVNGIEAVKSIKQNSPHVTVLMQTVFDEESIIFDAIRSGASGYLLKKSAPDRIVDAVRDAFRGGAPISPGIAMKVISFFQNTKDETEISNKNPSVDSSQYDLTKRELEILSELVEGKSYKMVASVLSISYHTVNTHVRHIYEKLHVHSLGEAVAKALKEKLV
jgi:DNA-binding NarL/FixJ family response regulator